MKICLAWSGLSHKRLKNLPDAPWLRPARDKDRKEFQNRGRPFKELFSSVIRSFLLAVGFRTNWYGSFPNATSLDFRCSEYWSPLPAEPRNRYLSSLLSDLLCIPLPLDYDQQLAHQAEKNKNNSIASSYYVLEKVTRSPHLSSLHWARSPARDNYSTRSVRLFIVGKRLWSFMDQPAVLLSLIPNMSDTKMADWSATNQPVMSWLFNAIEPTIATSLMFMASAK